MMAYGIDYFFESFKYDYLQRSLISTIIVGIAGGLIGVYIILRGLSFLGAGIAHSCFAGGALAILMGWNPFFTIFAFGEATALTIGFINEKQYSEKEDTTVGIMFSFTMALAVLFVGLNKTYSTNVQSLLFGNALTISEENLTQLIVVSAIILTLFMLLKKELLFITFDEEMAKVSGIPVRTLNYLFLMMVAGVITVSLKAIGAILVFAMIVTPAAAAYQWTYKTNVMLFLAAFFGALSSFLGLMVSFIYDLPTGSTIVIFVTLIFLISFLVSPKRRRSFKLTSAEDQEAHTKECVYCKDAIIKEECPYCLEEEDMGISTPHIHHHDHSHGHSEGEQRMNRSDTAGAGGDNAEGGGSN